MVLVFVVVLIQLPNSCFDILIFVSSHSHFRQCSTTWLFNSYSSSSLSSPPTRTFLLYTNVCMLFAHRKYRAFLLVLHIAFVRDCCLSRFTNLFAYARRLQKSPVAFNVLLSAPEKNTVFEYTHIQLNLRFGI